MMLYKRIVLSIILVTLIAVGLSLFATPQIAQADTAMECGQHFRAEFVTEADQHIYTFMAVPEDRVTAKIVPVGTNLSVWYTVTGPAGNSLKSGRTDPPGGNAFADFVLSSTGKHKLTLKPWGAGAYDLYFDCVRAKAAPTAKASGGKVQPTAAAPKFSGVGFPGLAPVDFSKVAKLPLAAGTPMSGAITPTGGEIIGYTLEGKSGDVWGLNFKRMSGNLNLGIVVLTADNKVVFQASLVTSDILTTRFNLPVAGQYTIGVFRIDLLPPDKPAPTAFQIEATVNPK